MELVDVEILVHVQHETAHAVNVNDVLVIHVRAVHALLVDVENLALQPMVNKLTTEQIRETYAQDVKRFIYSRVGGPAADDLLQQVFLKIHRRLETLHDDTKIKQRIFRVTHHIIIDWYRKESLGSSLHLEDTFWDSIQVEPESDKSILARNISSCLLPMVDELDPREQEIMLEYLAGTSLADIAKSTGHSLSNIKVIIHRTKKKLQQKYSQCCYQYRDDSGNLIDTRCTKNCGCENSILPPKN